MGQYGTDGEIDFVAIRDGQPEYYQVAQTALEDRVLQRELAPLRKIQDNYPKYLLTLDAVSYTHLDVYKRQGIQGMTTEQVTPM